jgi:hypothetical protein
VLSNIHTEALLQRLTSRGWRQVRRTPTRSRDRSRDGKLKYGTVSGAVVAVLGQSGSPLRFVEIHARVEGLLGMPIARGSVKQLLSAESRNRRQRFVRVSHGLYQMRGSN